MKPLDQFYFNAPSSLVFHCFEEFKSVKNSTSFVDFRRWLDKGFAKPELNGIFDILFNIEEVFNNSNSTITRKYKKDLELLFRNGVINNPNNRIEEIKVGVGDLHNGKSTALVTLNDKSKLVFKPASSDISSSYFNLIDWINKNSEFRLKKYKLLNAGEYQWLEFIDYKPCKTENDLKKYYQKAGALICIVYLLNGTDFHYENLIANGDTPILIDHETIIQPKVYSSIKNFFKHYQAFEEDSVIRSFLLPDKNKPNPGNCGLGYHKQTQYMSFVKKSVHPYSDKWKMETQLETHDLSKDNIPMLNGERIYANKYIDDLTAGFSSCYQLFLEKRKFLQSSNSPFHTFRNNKVRIIWRPTNLYVKIQNKLRLPKNLKTSKQQEQTLRNYLSVAFKNVPQDSQLKLILEHEIAQMLRGDIPYFEVNTSSQDLNTEFGLVKDFFDLSCEDNLARKLNKLSLEDLEQQKKIIVESILG